MKSPRLCASRRPLSLLWPLPLLVLGACGGGGSSGGDTSDAGPASGGTLSDGGGSTGGTTGGTQADARPASDGTTADQGVALPMDPQVIPFAVEADPPTTRLASIVFPSDLYRDAEGKLDLRGFPIPRTIPLLTNVLSEIHNRTPGFATSATMYVPFGGVVPTGRLPANGAASLVHDAALQLIDVGADSPHRGERIPLEWKVQEGDTAYLPANTLMVRAIEGRGMRPLSTYALVVTDAAGIVDDAFATTLAADRPADPATAAAWEVHAPLRSFLATEPALSGHVAGGSVFTTQDTIGELYRVYDYVKAMPAPELVSIESRGVQQNKFELFDGVYRAPRFQEGDIPYRAPGSGALHFDADGNPSPTGTEDIRFSLSVPNEDAPEGGWPIVMYGHGTGGDYHSFVGEKIAAILARQKMAVISIDQIHHGTRDNGACADSQDHDTCVELLFFNFLVPAAGRDNIRQSAIDFVSLRKFAQNLQIAPNQSHGGLQIALDPAHVAYMGHSQGGLNGALYLAIDDEVKGGMLSGAGGGLDLSVELKKLPTDLAAPFAALLGLPSNDPLTRWHPAMMLVETFVAPGDPVNYAPHWFADPVGGREPKSVFVTIGLHDQYTPPETNFALCSAAQIPLIEPVAQDIEGIDLLGLHTVFPPFRGNVAGGHASAGLAQYPDGDHFVIFDVPSAQQRYANFLHSLLTESPAQIY